MRCTIIRSLLLIRNSIQTKEWRKNVEMSEREEIRWRIYFLTLHQLSNMYTRHAWLNLCTIFLSMLDTSVEIRKPCEPSPCGFGAICRENNGVGSCTCPPDYLGDPYEECRPECTQNSDCLTRMACVALKCKDPCPGTCGVNAQCQSVNHLPMCTCILGYTGNPFIYCSLITETCKPHFHIFYNFNLKNFLLIAALTFRKISTHNVNLFY